MQKHLEWLKGRMVVSPQMESQLLEEEKEQIIIAYLNGYDSDCMSHESTIVYANDYYNKKFKQD